MSYDPGYPPPPGPYPPPPPPQGYYPPPYGYPPPVQHRTSGLAVASMVCGIVWVYWITSILAIIFAHVALAEIRRSGGTVTGRGMAIAGLVLGWIWVGLLVLGILVAAMGAKVHL